MSDDPFEINESQIPVMARAATVDLKATYEDFMIRYGRLEGRLVEENERAKSALRGFLRDLIDVSDALDRIVESAKRSIDGTGSTVHGNYAGVAATSKLFRRALSRQGVVRLELVGTVADPDIVDIQGYELDGTLPDETIIREIVPGYAWNANVLRRAVIIVSQRPTP